MLYIEDEDDQFQLATDGDTIIDDGLSVVDEEERDPYRRRRDITSAEAAALRHADSNRRCFSLLLLSCTLFASVVIASVRYFGNPNFAASASGGGGGGGGWNPDLWGNAAREREDAARLKSTLEYLIAKDVSLPATLEPEANFGFFASSYTPQYLAAVWIARDDPRRISIPSPSEVSRDDGPFKQRYSLAVLFFAAGGDFWIRKMKFLSGNHECDWAEFSEDYDTEFGVFCDGNPDMAEGEEDDWGGTRTVTSVRLIPNNLMIGTLPEELRQLEYLKEIMIANEPALSGSIPYQWSWLKHMQLLTIIGTGVNGKIPRQFAYLENLRLLYLWANDLSADTTQGDFDFFEEMSSLQFINLDINPKLTGTLPDFAVANLADLQQLSLEKCGFRGPLPSGMSMLKKLVFLNLEENAFTGRIDMLLGLNELEYLYLENNAFNDTLNDNYFAKLINLRHLDMSNNKFGGIVPKQLFGLFQLEVVDMSLNNLEGELPYQFDTDIEWPSNMKFLSLHSNNLEGPLYSRIQYLENLTTLDLSDNKFTGEIPEEISLLKDLNILFLGKNDFNEAPVPEWMRDMTHLTELSLKRSSLNDTIPGWLAELTDLTFLDLGENDFIQTIPQSLGNLTDLMVLILNKNRLEGSLGLGQLSNLEVLLIDDNDITGNTTDMCNHKLTHFIADCETGINSSNAELSCPCCTVCCHDNDTACNNHDEWDGNHIAQAEYGYGGRQYWDFGDFGGRGIVSPHIPHNLLQEIWGA